MAKPETQPDALGDFDFHRIHVRDSLTKRLVKTNPVKLIIHDGVRYVEHPVGSGNLYWENKEPAGRIEDGKIFVGKAHETYIKPMTEDEKLANEMAQTRQENAKLMKELEDIKKEQERLKKVAQADKASRAPVKPQEIKKG